MRLAAGPLGQLLLNAFVSAYLVNKVVYIKVTSIKNAKQFFFYTNGWLDLCSGLLIFFCVNVHFERDDRMNCKGELMTASSS